MPFKVIQGHRFGANRKPICDFLLLINTNFHPISHRLKVIADYWSNLRLWGPLWGVRATYNVHLRLIGKLLVIIELFSLGCFRFVTIHACDGQTDICRREDSPAYMQRGKKQHLLASSMLNLVGIPWSIYKIVTDLSFWRHFLIYGTCDVTARW